MFGICSSWRLHKIISYVPADVLFLVLFSKFSFWIHPCTFVIECTRSLFGIHLDTEAQKSFDLIFVAIVLWEEFINSVVHQDTLLVSAIAIIIWTRYNIESNPSLTSLFHDITVTCERNVIRYFYHRRSFRPSFAPARVPNSVSSPRHDDDSSSARSFSKENSARHVRLLHWSDQILP